MLDFFWLSSKAEMDAQGKLVCAGIPPLPSFDPHQDDTISPTPSQEVGGWTRMGKKHTRRHRHIRGNTRHHEKHGSKQCSSPQKIRNLGSFLCPCFSLFRFSFFRFGPEMTHNYIFNRKNNAIFDHFIGLWGRAGFEHLHTGARPRRACAESPLTRPHRPNPYPRPHTQRRIPTHQLTHAHTPLYLPHPLTDIVTQTPPNPNY